MIVTIWRHAEAGPAPTDRERELTDTGFDDVGFGCRQFHAALEARDIAPPDLILHSPWVRTEQTARIIASAFTHAPWREDPALCPGATVLDVDSLLANLQCSRVTPSHVVLVSHQPLVSQLVERYLGATGSVPSLSPGALVTVMLDTPAPDCARLRFWAVPPEYEAGL